MPGHELFRYLNKVNETTEGNSIYELLRRDTFPEIIERTNFTKSTTKPTERQQVNKTLKGLRKAHRETTTTAKPMCGSTVKLHIHNGQVNKALRLKTQNLKVAKYEFS